MIRFIRRIRVNANRVETWFQEGRNINDNNDNKMVVFNHLKRKNNIVLAQKITYSNDIWTLKTVVHL